MGPDEYIAAAVERLRVAQAAADAADAAVLREERLAIDAAARYTAASAAVDIATGIAAAVQSRAHERVAGLVSRCLAAVFDNPYEFRIEFERRRGKTEAILQFERAGVQYDPIEDTGLGVVDVAAFALRVAALILSRPPARRLLVLDEPFKFVSADRRGRLRALVEQLAAELDIQFVIVTHIDELRIGTVIDLGG